MAAVPKRWEMRKSCWLSNWNTLPAVRRHYNWCKQSKERGESMEVLKYFRQIRPQCGSRCDFAAVIRVHGEEVQAVGVVPANQAIKVAIARGYLAPAVCR